MALYFITGCSSGIGEAVAREAVKRGHKVIGAARRTELLEKLRGELGENFVPVALDVSDKEKVKAVADSMTELPDVVIMNAGVGILDDAETFKREVHDRTFAVNYFGALNVVEALFDRMKERGRGTFVATSSLAGYRGMPLSAAYSASKAAITAAFEGMRLTYGPWSGLKFLVIHPGFVDTPMTKQNKHPMPFMWQPDKAARYILDGVEEGRMHINFPFPTWLACFAAQVMPPKMLYTLLGVKRPPQKD